MNENSANTEAQRLYAALAEIVDLADKYFSVTVNDIDFILDKHGLLEREV